MAEEKGNLESEVYDFLIIGAGCAGASGAMYASRLNLKALMIAEMPGGLITTTHLVENWPGIQKISGPELASALLEHATAFGVPLVNARVVSVEKAVAKTLENMPPSEQGVSPQQKQSGFIVRTATKEFRAKTVLFATGTQHRKLGAPGEAEFENKGVSYCALCDAAFFKGKTVAVVGGGDSAAKEALLLSEYCPKVYVLVRKDILRAEPVNGDRVKAKSNIIEVKFGVEIAEVQGSDKVERVVLKPTGQNGVTGKEADKSEPSGENGSKSAQTGESAVSGEVLEVQGVFVAIGHLPLSDLAAAAGVALNDKKEIIINRRTETNIPGLYGAGDVCDTEFKQAITGSAEAVTASFFAYEYLGKTEVVFE